VLLPFFFRNHGQCRVLVRIFAQELLLNSKKFVIKEILNRVDRFAPKTLIREIRKCPRFDEGK